MRLVNIHYLNEGAILAQPVIDPMGRILLQAGVALNATYIQRLARFGFDMVFIEDERLEDVEVEIAIGAKTREQAYEAVRAIRYCIESNRLLQIDKLRSTIQHIIADLLSGNDVLGYLSYVRGIDDYTFHHSINTTILGLVIGKAAGYKENNLLELGLGLLMHDIGKIKIPGAILNKKEALSKEEFEEIKKHSIDGYNMLRDNKDLGLIAAHIALQHQERWDGSGYPRGLKGTDIHEYGRIAAVADVYEALTSKRVYREANHPYVGYEYLLGNSGVLFEPRLITLFSEHIAIYPNGSGIQLSNGQRGNVTKQNLGYPARPWVRMLYQDEEPLNLPLDYNLSEHPSLMIIGTENK